MMDQHTQPDQHERPVGEVIYEDDRIKQIYYKDLEMVCQLNKNYDHVLPIIYRSKINPDWIEAGKHPHGVLVLNPQSYDSIKIGPPPQ